MATGLTVGERAAHGLALSGDEDGRLDLGDARPGSFQDALNSVDAAGTVAADRFDLDVLHPFVHATCLAAAECARRTRRADWDELADDVGRTRPTSTTSCGRVAGRRPCASTRSTWCSPPSGTFP
ncbi:hypothetical protein [Blastococcus brunescens]|uniref:Uncharacterized protein n=1 Tax=Blastococcus brunescens TaxID=1564165 RepID=A0ABZ1B7N3_9ACTN|nr:hypothetical protein [Blastococcus sp. BMG 8361]WRL66749.1 hypothetical protein U6N30_15995 [Blastococcus sp. BMG 8361]